MIARVPVRVDETSARPTLALAYPCFQGNQTLFIRVTCPNKFQFVLGLPQAKTAVSFTYHSHNLKPYGKFKRFAVFGFLERFGRPALELANHTHRRYWLKLDNKLLFDILMF